MKTDLPAGWQRLPFDTVVVEDINEANLVEAGLGDLSELYALGELEGWGIFKKIKRAFKKIGRGIKKVIKKVARSKIFKLAIPILGGLVLGPLVGLAVPKLIKLVGSKAAGLIKQGRTRAQAVSMPDGTTKVGLFSPAEMAKIAAVVADPRKAITAAAIQKLFGVRADGFVVPGAQIKKGKVEMPVNGPQEMRVDILPPPPSITGSAGKFLLPAAAAMMFLKK